MKLSGGGLLLLAVFGCGRDAPPPGPPGLRDVNGAVIETKPIKVAETAPAQGASGAPKAETAGFEPPPLAVPADRAQAPAPALPVGAPAVDAGPAQPERDLSAELATLLNPHGTCLDFAAVARSGGAIKVSAQAMVLPSGSISRATVTAPGQPGTTLACLESRLRAARLAGPIPGAPRSISASIALEVAAAPAPPPAAAEAASP
ncbi:MAG: hypothetical protein RL385_6010 [Pseudomonadota bacterium]|jgi:hypothetical protein